MIYFNRQLQERLMRDFAGLLAQDGFLVVGKTEVLLAEVRHMYRTIDMGERIYQRVIDPQTTDGVH
jgi:chemotaxis protein methyltransferase CheR